ncbi:MAG: hypothetical protein SGI88_08655, partial [Candidatus Hydrogenedentes bacterium]|nr:hypothetical protein [Candidatus Hydrogenedentota bacterium]
TADSTQVEIEAELLEGSLKERVALIVMSKNFIPPRVVIIAQETLASNGPTEAAASSVIETKLHEELKRIEFELISPDALRALVPAESIAEYLKGDAERAAILAREMLADVVILGSGTSSVEREPGSANLDRVRAEVTLRIVRAEDGFVLDAPSSEAVVHSVNPREGGAQAIEDACGKLVRDVRTAIALGALGTAQQSGLLVTVKNVMGESHSKEVIDALKRCVDVEKADVVFQDESRVRVNLAFDGLISAFADCVSTVRLSFGSLLLESAVGRNLTLRVER